ncbi:Phosphotransferase enzyme family [Aspergillus sclerotialis]|uniref:Phosphotransferase enzyme family n=1 Tax=Aspergillus sclerotialis TaxID=2070753 RepID=A0A3A2Z6R5_9EURO|nr:Phosphotransferase enzyme family [Aspergillus sclerotialis]
MSDYMRKKDTPEKVTVLDPDVDEDILKTLYGRTAEILLELWKLDFDRIGSLAMDEPTGTWTISKRPVTVDMNELTRACGLDDCMPVKTYTSSTDYIMSLIDLQWKNLRQQRNSVYRSEDCRQKYTCRYLMQAVAPHFISGRDNYGPFKLFSDDLSPNNVLVDDNLNVTAVIDWEFCYAAQPQFAGSLPWWLILQHPPSLVNNIGPDAFLDTYLPKAEIFLQALQEKEADNGLITAENKLSAPMRESLKSRSAWFNFACRMVIDVDLIYWDLLDDFCWGPTRSMAERTCQCICGAEIHKDFEDFVRHKIRQLNEYRAELDETEMIEYKEEKYIKFVQNVSDQTSATRRGIQIPRWASVIAFVSLMGVAAATIGRRHS